MLHGLIVGASAGVTLFLARLLLSRFRRKPEGRSVTFRKYLGRVKFKLYDVYLWCVTSLLMRFGSKKAAIRWSAKHMFNAVLHLRMNAQRLNIRQTEECFRRFGDDRETVEALTDVIHGRLDAETIMRLFVAMHKKGETKLC